MTAASAMSPVKDRADPIDAIADFTSGFSLEVTRPTPDGNVRPSQRDRCWIQSGDWITVLVGTVGSVGQCPAPAGRRTVKTEPLPGSLVTVTSPPIMRASLRVMARPSPVPP